MHLLDTSKITLHEFLAPNIPDYAILSHRWASTEISFNDIRNGKAEKYPGYAKIQKCCAQAALDGWKYVWIDTCCIDKSSSAQLSEAVNSMYQWYKESRVCYAYLSDVPTAATYVEHWRDHSEFRRSEWFVRGWTLQELLAPERIIFFDQDWVEIGTKPTLINLLSSITGIKGLHDPEELQSASVAQKMSWASRRLTSRVEDMAYYLIGLFGINMPIIYGEGKNAFYRLQLEIMGKVDDESIFVWEDHESYTSGFPSGLLSPSPAAFQNSSDMVPTKFDKGRPSYSMTNRGLQLEPTLFTHDPRTELVRLEEEGDKSYTVPLNCSRKETGEQVAIILVGDHETGLLLSWNEKCRKKAIAIGRKLIFVEQFIKHFENSPTEVCDSIFLSFHSPFLHNFRVFKKPFEKECSSGALQPTNKADEFALMDYGDSESGILVVVLFNNSTEDLFAVSAHFFPSSYSGINFYQPTTDEKLNDMVASAFPNMLSACLKKSVDRFSAPLSSGKSVSAALRLGVNMGERRLLLKITIDPEGGLLWPPPPIHEEINPLKSYFANVDWGPA